MLLYGVKNIIYLIEELYVIIMIYIFIIVNIKFNTNFNTKLIFYVLLW